MILATMNGVTSASATSCSSDRPLRDLAGDARLIVFGNLRNAKNVGFELADGTISAAPLAPGISYLGQVFRLRIRVHRALKGSAARIVEANGTLPILSLGSCPDRQFQKGRNAVFLLAERPSGLWVVEGWEGVIYTDEPGVAGIQMQFQAPTQVQ